MSSNGVQMSQRERQYAWERGDIDYTGSDRFSNIMEKLSSELSKQPQPTSSTRTTPANNEPPSTAASSSAKKGAAKK